MITPDIIGAQKEIVGYEVQLYELCQNMLFGHTHTIKTYANQKNETAKMGAENIPISNLNSGGTGEGAYFSMARSYRGLNISRYYRSLRSANTLGSSWECDIPLHQQ
jgi:hypothetical protein